MTVGTWNPTQEISFAMRIAIRIVGQLLDALEHTFAGQFPIIDAGTAITIEINKGGAIQDGQGERLLERVVGADIAIDVTEGVSRTMCFCLLEAELHQELEETLAVKAATEVSGRHQTPIRAAAEEA